MPEVVFLEAPNGRRLAKTYTEQATISYPMVKNFKSHHRNIEDGVEGLRQKERLMQSAAEKGYCMLRGTLTHRLEFESRSGKTNKDELCHSLLLDIDGLELPEDILANVGRFHGGHVRYVADAAIAQLPEDFHDVSYIAQASNSFGLKGNLVSLHLEFLLKEPVAPRALKLLLRHLNFVSPYYEQQIELNPSGISLSYKIDITTADNSRLIYIAPPLVAPPIVDPFENPAERIIFERRRRHSIDAMAILESVNPELIEQVTDNKVKNIRKRLGLPAKKPRLQLINHGGSSTRVITNPDASTIQPLREEGNYIRCNVNNGDSQAYYIDKRNPTVVWNFKGEHPFLLEAADPDLLEELLTRYADVLGENGNGNVPFCFRDITSDSHYYGFVNTKTEEIEWIESIEKGNLKHFFADYGFAMPDIMPQTFYEFRPNDNRQFQLKERFVNKYVMPDILKNPGKILPVYEGVSLGDGALLEMVAPTCYKVMHSIVGSDNEEFEYFLNWIAYIVQTREKATTAYILHGVPGTGKGVFFSNIVAPLLGRQYCMNMGLKDLDDLSNDWVSKSLFVMVDEFRLADAANSGRINNILKHYITEKRLSIRAMHRDHAEKESFTNFIFTANHDDMIELQEGDRRFNVCPPQMVPLFERHPELREDLDVKIAEELPRLAKFILTYQVDEQLARTARLTISKENMRQASMKTTDAFCQALKIGDLDYFMDWYFEPPTSNMDMDMKIPYDNIIKRAAATVGTDHNGNPREDYIGLNEARVLYARIFGKDINGPVMGKMLRMHRVPFKRVRPNNEANARSCITVTWSAADHDLDEFLRSTTTEKERGAMKLQVAQ